MIVFVFERFEEGLSEKTKRKKRKQIEAIEAELVYLIRKKNKKWPKYQSEIHFNNDNPAALAIAERLHRTLTLKD